MGGLTLAIGVGDLAAAPVTDEEGLAARSRGKLQHALEVMLFHHQDEIRPAYRFQADLARAMGVER